MVKHHGSHRSATQLSPIHQLRIEQPQRQSESVLLSLCETFGLTQSNILILKNAAPHLYESTMRIVELTAQGICQLYLSKGG